MYGREQVAGAKRIYEMKAMDKLDQTVHFFGDNVTFDKYAWLPDGR